jgi:citrate synthase
LKQFEDDIRKYTLVNEEMKSIIDGFPKRTMGVAALTSALTAFNPKSVNVDNEKKCIKPFARRWEILVIATWTYRKAWVIL